MKTFISTLMAILLWGAFPSSAMGAGKQTGCPQYITPAFTPAFPGAFDCEVTVEQGWDAEEQQIFWFTGQGSNIIPYSWFLNLEQANSAKLFRSSDNIDSYRYLPQKFSDLNPDSLPIGFTKDDTKGNELYGKMSRKWLGLTCAACHTGQLEFGKRKILIDGAPAMADFQSFFEAMATAMRATYNSGDNGKKFKRFAAAIKAYNDKKYTGDFTDEATLLKHLGQMTVILETRNVRNSGAIRFGNSRLDALGSILNQVRLAAGRDIPEGKVDAPVSYPFIWDTPQHDRVQWNGSVYNAGTGALGRNVGEVLGVFGSIDLRSGQSSVNIAHLGKLEKLIWELKSPKWKDTGLPKVDANLVDFGKGVYAMECGGCHALPIERNNREFKLKANMVSIKYIRADSTAAENFKKRSDDRDLLTLSVGSVIVHELQKDKIAALKTIKAGQPESVKDIIKALAKKHLKGLEEASPENKRIKSLGFLGALKAATEIWENQKLTKKQKKAKCFTSLLCYKARPLNGVWATGPYLHNGSVRTIRQLLVPSERQKEFNVGSRQYDPMELGFKDAGDFVMNTTLPGNLNKGHKFHGTYFRDQKYILKALMEYLKTL